ncbi:type II toxin-antitoxin system RelE family toxin [Nostoc sp.]|uniref:type II toxin-antitoxin system RelE family toxin n=1 Tax=Nostoc sp. TaxID=1180 RepID=UPI003FA5CCEB
MKKILTRIRVGDYRVIYDIFDDLLVVNVVEVGHRKIFIKMKVEKEEKLRAIAPPQTQTRFLL